MQHWCISSVQDLTNIYFTFYEYRSVNMFLYGFNLLFFPYCMFFVGIFIFHQDVEMFYIFPIFSLISL